MSLLFLSILFPLAGFVTLAFFGRRLSENLAALIGVGSVALAACVTVNLGLEFTHLGAGAAFTQKLWTWVKIEGFAPDIALRLDGLSLTMLGVVTGVGFFIHLFASWYMRGEEGYSRFFAYMNLFVASMLLLVLGDSLVTLYFGWEGVGLCSYLLIGFYYQHSPNGGAAQKAFIITRVGDVFMAIGLFLLYEQMGTLNIQELLQLAPQHFAIGSGVMTLATMLLLGGAVGKSAQLPLQTWLADAMAGPTPVSALIHAATMVTAGVYLIARTHTLFQLAPVTLELVGIVGAATLLLSGFAALVQTDIKRILAYSTMSQIGYMFLALGVGAWSGAIFHLMTHAFFKALLFLSSGAVIIACHHEQNIFKMGGLRRKIPLVYACFLVGGAALAAVPWVTVGFYSKDEILWQAVSSDHMGLFLAGLFGAFLTSIYTFRLIFVVFHGEEKTHAHAIKGVTYWLPLSALLVLSTAVGALIHPPLSAVLPASAGAEEGAMKGQIELLSGVVAVFGIIIAGGLFLVGQRRFVSWLRETAVGRFFWQWWFAAWGFDWIYRQLFVRPFLGITVLLRRDPADQAIGLLPWLAQRLHHLLSATQTGQLRHYATVMAMGAVVMLLAVFFVMH